MGLSSKEQRKNKYKNSGEDSPIQFWVTWTLIQIIIKMLEEDKEDINHGEGMDNFLNEYELDDQMLKLVKEAKIRFQYYRRRW